jgi:hypothetical protein
MSEASAHLVDHVLPEVPIRQWVLTFPYPIRFLLAYRPELLRAVRRIFVRTLFSFLRRRARDAGLDAVRPGAVVVVQRFGSALNLNVHLHALVLDGVFETPRHGTAPRFHALEILEDRDVERVLARIQRRVLRHLEKLGLLSSHDDGAAEDPAFEEEPLLAACYAGSIVGRQAFGPQAGQPIPRLGDPTPPRRSPTPTPLCARAAGFSLHAAVRIPARERHRRERLARYVLRPPFAAEQLSLTPEGKLLYRLARPFADGTEALRFEPAAFLERLVALIPRPGRPMLTYHGILAPAASWRDHVVPASPPPRAPRCQSSQQPTASVTERSTPSQRLSGLPDQRPSEADPPTRRHERLTWAQLLRRTYAIEVLVCDLCGARRELIAFLTAPDSIRRILEYLGLPTRPPPIRHAPAALFELN